MNTARPKIARVAITLGVIGSLAGNVTWAYPRSPVLVGVGVFMALVLPVAVRLWEASKGVTGWARLERAVVMAFICAGAAMYTLLHTSLLLHALGLPGVICWVPGAVMEALVVQAARASAPVTAQKSRTPAPSKTTSKAPAKSAASEQPAPATSPVAAPAAVPDEETREERDRRLARERQARRRAKNRESAA